jgi:hypothetical protein
MFKTTLAALMGASLMIAPLSAASAQGHGGGGGGHVGGFHSAGSFHGVMAAGATA